MTHLSGYIKNLLDNFAIDSYYDTKITGNKKENRSIEPNQN